METRICPKCEKEKEITSFECLPIDARCNACIPPTVSAELLDKQVALAGRKMSQLFDAKAVTTLKPLERLLTDIYEEWGGSRCFSHDLVEYVKRLAEGKKYGAAVAAMLKIAQLHAKVDRMKLEDDWKSMDDDQVRETLKLKMIALMAEMAADDTKASAMKSLMGNLNG